MREDREGFGNLALVDTWPCASVEGVGGSFGRFGGGSVVGSGCCIPTDTNVSPQVNRGHLLVVYLGFVGFGEKTTGVERVFESLRM